jgi:two-component system sensor histidine kinase/response regulator
MTAKPELAGKKEILSSLHESAQAAVTLLDNLLYWGRSQADELKASPLELDLGILVTEVKALYTYIAMQKGIKLTSSIPPGTVAFADKSLLTIIIRNLVSNAIKFTPAKGTVSILAQTEGDKVHISVSDTGIGIKPEILEQFREEGQLTSSMGTDKEIGTGLGLQLVSDLVTKNHGILKVESSPDKGSTFTFTLPIKKIKTNNENI